MTIRSKRVLLGITISVLLLTTSSRAAAQDAPGAPATQPPDPTPPQTASGDAPATQQTSHGRLFGVMPDFLTVTDSTGIRPLTTRQKYNVVTRTAFDWFQFGWYTFKSGMDEATGTGSDYGNGFRGFGKLWASNFADGTTENYFVGAVWPSLLHQDPRYFRKARGHVGARAGYAVTRVFVTRNDAGHHRFNFSEILGAASAALVANVYHPEADRTINGNVKTMSVLISYDMLGGMLKEFWPDVAPLMHHGAHGAPAHTP